MKEENVEQALLRLFWLLPLFVLTSLMLFECHCLVSSDAIVAATT